MIALCSAAIGLFGGSFDALSFLLFAGIWGVLAVLFLFFLPRLNTGNLPLNFIICWSSLSS